MFDFLSKFKSDSFDSSAAEEVRSECSDSSLLSKRLFEQYLFHFSSNYETVAFGKSVKNGEVETMAIGRGGTGIEDVEIDIKFCGVCHTDVHYIQDELPGAKFPMVPGHEIAGVVAKV